MFVNRVQREVRQLNCDNIWLDQAEDMLKIVTQQSMVPFHF